MASLTTRRSISVLWYLRMAVGTVGFSPAFNAAQVTREAALMM